MPLYRVTTRCRTNTNGVYIEPGMTVEVVSKSLSNPILADGGKLVNDAFQRVYAIDIKKAGCLNTVYLACERIG